MADVVEALAHLIAHRGWPPGGRSAWKRAADPHDEQCRDGEARGVDPHRVGRADRGCDAAPIAGPITCAADKSDVSTPFALAS